MYVIDYHISIINVPVACKRPNEQSDIAKQQLSADGSTKESIYS